MTLLRAGIKLNKTDLKNLQNKISALSAFPGTANQIMKHEAEQAVGRMKRDSPFKTGRLRREIEVKSQTVDDILITSEAIDPKTGVDYAPIREYGLDGYAAQPYFRHNIDLMYVKLGNRIRKKLIEINRKGSVSSIATTGSFISPNEVRNKITKYLKK